MRFFDRVEELKMLTEIERRSRSNAQFTVVTGRRRVGNWQGIWNLLFNSVSHRIW